VVLLIVVLFAYIVKTRSQSRQPRQPRQHQNKRHDYELSNISPSVPNTLNATGQMA